MSAPNFKKLMLDWCSRRMLGSAVVVEPKEIGRLMRAFYGRGYRAGVKDEGANAINKARDDYGTFR
jgi:hypothetical protein